MALSTSCCLNLSPPPPTPNTNSTSPSSQLSTAAPATRPNPERCWRISQCVMGAACVIVIGLEMSGGSSFTGNQEAAVSIDISGGNTNLAVAASKKKVVQRWSDKRSCPPWRVNSLETIVPENLPRPSARRRLEAVVGQSKVAPPADVATVTKLFGRSCFSM